MAVAGYSASISITIGGTQTTVHDISSNDLPFKNSLIDVTSFSSASPGTEQYIPGLLGAQIKESGFLNAGDAGQIAIENAFFQKTKVSLVVSPDGIKTYSFSGWISDYEVKSTPKDAATLDFTVQLDGGVTVGTVS